MQVKTFYNTILSQTFSPCGNYLIVGDIYGQVNVFNIQNIVNPSENVLALSGGDLAILSNARKPKNSFQVKAKVQIGSLLTTPNFLLVGSLGEIAGYTWTQVLTQHKAIQPTWKIEFPNTSDSFQKVEVNCMIFDKENEAIYAGCSDNKIYAISIENGKILHTLEKHTDFIHSIVNQGNNIISGGEDGLVSLWDVRTKNSVHCLEPHKNSKLERPEIGKWIGAVAANDDWLMCGGGPRLSLWHFRSLNFTNVFPLEDKGIHVAHFYENKAFAGGRDKNYYQMNINGDIISMINTSSVSIFSAVYQTEPFSVMCLSGSSPKIDICSNFNYKDQVLTVEYDFP